MRVKLYIAAAAVLLPLAGCGSTEPRSVPDVRYERLDVAEERLDRLGLGYEEIGGGAFGVVVRSEWTVCRQEPAPGKEASTVRLIVDRSCPPPPVEEVVLPDFVGDPLEGAERALERLDVGYEVASWTGGRVVRAGARVCDQEPNAGTRAGEVTLYVAADCTPPQPPPPLPPPPSAVVPPVVGLDLGEAEEVLVAAGVDYVTEPPMPFAELYWDVCAQRPGPGRRAAVVTLYVEPRCPR
jgi:beta-lactam-binding protein with PASTA domain